MFILVNDDFDNARQPSRFGLLAHTSLLQFIGPKHKSPIIRPGQCISATPPVIYPTIATEGSCVARKRYVSKVASPDSYVWQRTYPPTIWRYAKSIHVQKFIPNL